MRVSVLWQMLLLLTAVSMCHGQTPTATRNVSLCKPDSIAATVTFAELPLDRQWIDVHLHNTTAQPCRLLGELAPSFAVDGHSAAVKTCWLCEGAGDRNAEAVPRTDEYTLQANGNAHVTYRWSSLGSACQKVDWADFNAVWDGHFFLLFESTYWKPQVCSVLQVSGYQADASFAAQTSTGNALLQIDPPKVPIYADEWVTLSIRLKSPHASVAPTEHRPELYGVYSPFAGVTRFETVLPEGYGALVQKASDQPHMFVSGPAGDLPRGYMRVCDTAGKNDSTAVSLPASLEAPVHVVPQVNLKDLRGMVWRAEDAQTQEPVFVTADIHFEILDPETLPQNWGAETDGIRAGLSVDKTTYTFGETIPLHVRWQNVFAKQRLGITECGDPRPNVEIQDASHHVLGIVEIWRACLGHGWGPFSIALGKHHRDFLSLVSTESGYIAAGGKPGITAPGVYYLSAVWSPVTLVKRAEGSKIHGLGSAHTLGDRYATARSLPVRIELLAKENKLPARGAHHPARVMPANVGPPSLH